MRTFDNYVQTLKADYTTRIEEIDSLRSSDSILQVAKNRKTGKRDLIRLYRDYLEASLFGIPFQDAFMGLNTREQLRELFAGSAMEKELDDIFLFWDFEVKDADIWEMIQRRK